jgi:exo-beta-1,3-glucanase (GH17 family)
MVDNIAQMMTGFKPREWRSLHLDLIKIEEDNLLRLYCAECNSLHNDTTVPRKEQMKIATGEHQVSEISGLPRKTAENIDKQFVR